MLVGTDPGMGWAGGPGGPWLVLLVGWVAGCGWWVVVVRWLELVLVGWFMLVDSCGLIASEEALDY